MTRVKMNTKGFTLMEVLISIAMVGLLFAPMLNFFSHSAKINVNAKNMQRANTVAQSVMEEVRSYETIADMVATYEDTKNSDLIRTKDKYFKIGEPYSAPVVASGGGFINDKYYFVHKGLKNDGKEYTAKITVDTTKYQQLNNTEIPVISSLGSGSTVMAAEKDETQKTLYEYQSRYHSAPENNGNSISLEALAEKLQKRIKVKINDTAESDTMVQVTIYNEYSITENWAGCTEPIQSEYLYNEEVVYEKLKGIYLFYNYDMYVGSNIKNILQGIDVEVNYNHHSGWKCDYALYAICQKVFDASKEPDDPSSDITDRAEAEPSIGDLVRPTIKKRIMIPNNLSDDTNNVPIISNFKYYLDTGIITEKGEDSMDDKLVKKEKIQRLSEVTIEVCDSNGKSCVVVTSTRGE